MHKSAPLNSGRISRGETGLLLTLLLLALVVSARQPYDRLTWFLEALPVLIGLPLALATGRRFPLTPLLYRLLFVHALILLLGAHYTYARVPPGLWLQDWLELSRNHYDRLGHLAQGFVPAILVREILLRLRVVTTTGWLPFIVVCICMAVSACYELIEWGVALAAEQGAIAFLGTQGDHWDTQADMLMALIGALLALGLLSRRHNRALKGGQAWYE